MRNIAQKLKYTAMGLAGVAAILVGWSFIEPHTFHTENETAVIPNLPKSWQGKQIAQLSDFQIGIWGDNSDTARRTVEELIKAKPAAVLISGDFIYRTYLTSLKRSCKPLDHQPDEAKIELSGRILSVFSTKFLTRILQRSIQAFERSITCEQRKALDDEQASRRKLLSFPQPKRCFGIWVKVLIYLHRTVFYSPISMNRLNYLNNSSH